MDELQQRIAADGRQIVAGHRPRYHVLTCYDGLAVDVRIRELPLAHLFVPEAEDRLEAARILIARTLGVPPASFDLAFDRFDEG